MKANEMFWMPCPNCLGVGKKNYKLRKLASDRYHRALREFEINKAEGRPSSRPKIPQYLCEDCQGSGLIPSASAAHSTTNNYPHVAIIGAGIGGVALAVACLHRSIPFTLYERDLSFDARAQGYGLTLQQASNAIKGLGLFSVAEGVHSTRHVVHTVEGKEILEWGRRTHLYMNPSPKRKNMHIPRQTLRMALLEQLGGQDRVQWGHRLLNFRQCDDKSIELNFQVQDKIERVKADLVVGADGVRSVIRNLIIGEEATPLRYLGFVVILGICSLELLKEVKSELLDSATVFQTVNGYERIYIMPYTKDSVMWQFSFPLLEEEAKALSAKGPLALKEEACKRACWHIPVPQILSATKPEHITGYPVYDREILKSHMLENAGPITLIGDAAHPMSPFKGQGANQALLDALLLARLISTRCFKDTWHQGVDLRKLILTDFEEEMIERSSAKVKGSAEAVEFLHSKCVLREDIENNIDTQTI